MSTGSEHRTENYVAVEGESGMTVISVDARDPWAAIEALRAHVKAHQIASPRFSLLASDAPLGRTATLIDLTSRLAG